MRNHKSRYYWAKYNNYGFCQTGQLIHAVHVYLGHTFTLPSTSRKKHLNKNIIPIEKEYWIVTFPFEWQSKMCRTVKWKHGGAFCQKNFWPQKIRIFNISKFSPKKHQKDRGDPQMAGQCYLIFTLSDPVIESDLRQLNSACSLKRARFGNKQIVKMAQSIFNTQIVTDSGTERYRIHPKSEPKYRWHIGSLGISEIINTLNESS